MTRNEKIKAGVDLLTNKGFGDGRLGYLTHTEMVTIVTIIVDSLGVDRDKAEGIIQNVFDQGVCQWITQDKNGAQKKYNKVQYIANALTPDIITIGASR